MGKGGRNGHRNMCRKIRGNPNYSMVGMNDSNRDTPKNVYNPNENIVGFIRYHDSDYFGAASKIVKPDQRLVLTLSKNDKMIKLVSYATLPDYFDKYLEVYRIRKEADTLAVLGLIDARQLRGFPDDKYFIDLRSLDRNGLHCEEMSPENDTFSEVNRRTIIQRPDITLVHKDDVWQHEIEGNVIKYNEREAEDGFREIVFYIDESHPTIPIKR